MGFILPAALFFALSLPVLLILYFLKVKRRPERVSSTWLWREALQDTRASVPFQRLRRNLLMFLQLLALALLTFALARPVLNLVRRESSSVLILVDTSASMGMRSTPNGPTRLEEAISKATRLIASLTPGSQALLMDFADRAIVTVPLTTDRAKLRSALGDLEVKAAPGDLFSAVSLAASLIESAPNPRVVIFSDSAELSEEILESLHSTPVVVEACGEEAVNFGWTALDLRQRSATSGTYDLFGQIKAYGGVEREVTVRIEADDQILEVRRVRLFPDEESGIVIENLRLSGEPVIHSVAESDPGDPDALAMDNEVWAQVRPSQKLRLLLCTPGNPFLSLALMSLRHIEVINVAPDQSPPTGHYDLAVYDRAIPRDPPAAPALYIAYSPWDRAGETENAPPEVAVGEITDWDPDHPVTRLVQWSTVAVFAARPGQVQPGSRVLVEADDVPLLILGRAENQVVLHLTFDLFRSNLPRRLAFPIFIKSAVDWLTHDRAGKEVRALRGGETFSVSVDDPGSRLTIRSPNNRAWTVTPGPDGTISFGETYTAGLWSLEADGKVIERFGVNLLNAQESDPALIQSATANARGEIRQTGLESDLRSNREIWKWIVIVVLGLLMIEWIAYQRSLAV
ncbi:BatA and WFA domain-containing protein [Candidatus Sumerlaeota bacterium]|nr:BatA and WFA domain-containing protein [Candidatus Sumerlaeota bacterium]